MSYGEAQVREDTPVVGAPPATETRATPGLATWQLFLLVSAGNLAVLAFYNQAVLSDEVYGRILGGLDGARLDEYLGRARRMEVVAYATAPLFLFVRFAFVALFCQLLLLLTGREVRFGGLFRIATWAALPLLAQLAIQVGWLSTLDPWTLTAADFRLVPGSLSSLFMDVGSQGTALYGLLSLVGAFELTWAGILVLGLMEKENVRAFVAVATVAIAWGTITLFKWGVLLYSSAASGL